MIIRAYRAGNRKTSTKMTFLLNPYDAKLDLEGSKDDRKLFQEACKGHEGSDKFSGKKTTYNDFVKLIGKSFEDVRVMETLMITTIWDSSNVDPEAKKLPKKTGIVNMFTSTNLTKEQVKVKSELVWEDTTFINTPKYFKIFGTNPTDDDTLNTERNNVKLKHVIWERRFGQA